MMAIKAYNTQSFVHSFLTDKPIKNDFLQNINKILNGSKLRVLLNKYYKKGTSVTGCPAYDPLLLFKMTLLQTWYDLSDMKTEQYVNQHLSFRNFCGLALLETVPDHTAIARFRQIIIDTDAHTALLNKVNNQLEQQGAKVNRGYTIDASITITHRKPSGPTKYVLSQDVKQIDANHRTKSSQAPEPNVRVNQDADATVTETIVRKVVHPAVDQQAAWTKKNMPFK